jgi:hypothetical protein
VAPGLGGIPEDRHAGGSGYGVLEELQRFALDVRGYPETFSHRRREITQHPCGNETQSDRRERVCSA